MHFREAYPSGFGLSAVATSQHQINNNNSSSSNNSNNNNSNNNNSNNNNGDQVRARSFNRSGFSTQQDMSMINSVL